jgi:hypothetical protein
MRTLPEILDTPSADLTDEEIALLAPEDQRFVRAWRDRKAKEDACVASGGHERIATLDTQRGWHEGHCAKCGKNMNYDSGD